MKKVIQTISMLMTVLLMLIVFSGCRFESHGEQDTSLSVTVSSQGDPSHSDPSHSDTSQHEKQTDEEEAPTDTEESPETEEASTDLEETKNPESALSPTDRFREDYNLGTCKALSGNISVILFYMDDFESEWTKAGRDLFTKNEIKPGLTFLEQEAKKYGMELNLTVKKVYSSLYYDDEVITSVKDTGFATADVLWQAATQIHFSSTEKMINEFRSRYQTEEIVCLTIFNKDGTSYALNPKRGADIRLDEHCLVFVRDLHTEENGPAGSQAAVIAHEMLHLFGAEDLYAPSTRKSLAKIHYPGDIMLSAAYDIDTNTVDAATAFYIGWTDQVPDVLHKKGW